MAAGIVIISYIIDYGLYNKYEVADILIVWLENIPLLYKVFSEVYP